MEIDNIIFIVIIAILIIDFITERSLSYLNLKNWKTSLPDYLKSFYDKEKYSKAMAYHKSNAKLGSISSTLGFIIVLIVLLFDGFAIIDNWVREISKNPIIMSLLFFGVIGIAGEIISIPFSVYKTFNIEERFDFNNTDIKTFIFDRLKSYLLAIIIGGGLISLIVWFYQVSGDMFWLYTWLALSAFMLFMSLFYSQLIVPLFNKQTPLEDGELRSKIEKFANKVGFKLDNIYVIDGSKRSNKANAYFTGLWKKKRIVLFDTLIKEHEDEEIVSVLAHEIGHNKHKHTTKQLISGLLSSAIMLFLLGLFIKQDGVLSEYLAESINAKPSFHIGVLVFGLLYSPVSNFGSILSNIFSRKYEYQADKFAAVNYSAEALKSALIKLSRNNLSNLNPHPAYVWYYYSHPPLLDRLYALNKIEKSQ